MNSAISKKLAGVLALCASAMLFAPNVWSVPTLWGVDEDDGELFRIDDYTNPSGTFTSYGQLKWDDNGTIRTIGNDIEAFTIRSDGMAYMVLDDNLGDLGNDRGSYNIDGPVLMRFDMNTASTTQDNVVEVIGVVDIYFNTNSDDITGVDFDAATGQMYAIFEDYNSSGSNRSDRLLEIDHTNGNVTSNIRFDEADNWTYNENVKLGEDITFHEGGNLLVIDEYDNDVYYVNPDTAELISVYDGDTTGGIGSAYFEALAWDAENDNLVAFSDSGNFFALITEGNGGNSSFGGVSGLTDVEGLAFWNPGGGGSVPLPATAALLVLGMLGVMRKRR